MFFLPAESGSRTDSLRRVTTAPDFEIDAFAQLVPGRLRTDPGHVAIQAIPGVGPGLAGVFVAEIGLIDLAQREPVAAHHAGHRRPRQCAAKE
jgi:transposase